VSNGKKVAEIKDVNNNEFAINDGKKSIGNKIPTKIDLEKSGVGNNSKPTVNPMMIDK